MGRFACRVHQCPAPFRNPSLPPWALCRPLHTPTHRRVRAINRSRVVEAMVVAGLWQDTVLLFTADNGGPPYVANSNWPMRGGKWTSWEGGTHITGLMHSPSRLPARPKNFTG